MPPADRTRSRRVAIAYQQREAIRMVREGQSLRAVAHHYHVAHSTIVRTFERPS